MSKQNSDPKRPQPAELPPGITAKEVEDHLHKLDLREKAHTEPLPGPLLEAFAGLPAEIAGLRVRPICHYDFVVLRRLDSPILRQMLNRKGGKRPTPFSDEEGYAMVYQFTRPAAELADWFDKFSDVKKAAVAFRRLARNEIGLKLGPLEVGLLVKAIEREFTLYFSTVVKYGPKEEADGSFPLPPAPPQTASAGGSTTSVN